MTAGTEGAIFVWTSPEQVVRTRADDDMPEGPEGGVDTMNTGGPAPANAPKQ